MAAAALLALAAAIAGGASGASAQEEPGRDAPPGHVPADQPLILPPAERAKVDAVAELLICHCGCARQTVKDCTCGIADQIKKDIWRDLGAGRNGEQILASYVAQHGTEFRSMPETEGLGMLAWTLPYIALAVAILVILPIVARWTRRGGPTGGPRGGTTARPAGAGAGEKDPYASQVEKELSELD